MTPQPLKWHGGKHYLAKKIIELMPPHTHYVEAFAGGLAVLLEKDPEGVSEVVNDLNGELTNFWRCLQSPEHFQGMVSILENTPFSQVGFERASPLTDAINFFIRCRMSRAGNFKEFATLSRNRTRRGMNEQVSAWLTAIEGLPEVHARLKRVVILNMSAVDVIRSQDGENTLFYLDPPYLDVEAGYKYMMTEEQHQELLDTTASCVGYVMISGYPSALYEKELKSWNKHVFQVPNNISGSKNKRLMEETLWLNF